MPLNYRLTAADHEYILNHAGVTRGARRRRVHRRSSTRSAPRLHDGPALDRRDRTTGATATGWLDWDELVGARVRRPAAAGGARRERRGLDQLHVGHDRAPQGRDAHAPQLLHERVQPDRPSRRPPRRRRAVDAADVPLQRLGRRLRAHRHGRHARRPARDRRREDLRADRARGRHVRLHGAGGAAHDPRLPRQGASTRSAPARASPSPARRRRPRSSSGSRRELGWDFIQIYGLTETAPLLTVSTPDHAHEDGRLGAARARGRRRRSASRSPVLDDDGKPVPQGRRDGRRGLRALERRVQGLLGAARRDRQGDPRRLLPHRRPRGLGRDRHDPHRRPQEGRDHLRRREHQLARDRGRALPAPGGARVRGDRRAAREVGRDAEGAGRAAARREADARPS